MKILNILLIALFVNSPTWANIPPNLSAPADSLNEIERNILKSLPQTTLSYALKDARTKENIAGHLSSGPSIPASVMKILTSFFALSELGANYTFNTSINGQGSIKDSVFNGDIYLIGSGDPLLTDARIQNLVLQLEAKGIKKINGNFHYDDSQIISLDMISPLGLGDQTYNPGVSALNSDFNRMTVIRDDKTKSFIPLLDTPSFRVEEGKEDFTPSQRFALSTLTPEVWHTNKKIKYSRFEDLPVRSPSLQTANRLRSLAKRQGIELPEPSFKKSPSRMKTLAISKSPTLWQIVELTLEYSNNLLAESLLLASVSKNKKITQLNEAASEMLKWYQKKFPKIDFTGTVFTNGSGLSTTTAISPLVLAEVLTEIRLSDFDDIYFSSLLNLPEKSLWFRRYLNSPELAYRVWAKTGSLDYVNNISGYLYTKSGKIISFSLFLIDENKRAQLNGEDGPKQKQLRDETRRWKDQTNQMLYDLLYSWYERY